MEKDTKAKYSNHDETPAQSLAVKRGQESMKIDLMKVLEAEEQEEQLREENGRKVEPSLVQAGVAVYDDKEPDLYEPNNPYVVRFVCLSDTHTYHNKVKMPKGDVLLHTGDFTMKGRADEIVSFSKWLCSHLNHPALCP